MFKKITRILSLIVFIFVVSSTLIWFYLNKDVETVTEDTVNLITEDFAKEKPKSEKIFDYGSEASNDHIVFNIGKFDFEFNRVKDLMDTKLVVKNGTKILISKKYPNAVSSIYKILFKDKNIILVNYYSGGAHCCYMVIPYLIDGEKVIEGTELDLGNIDIFFKVDPFFIKDDKLFVLSRDDRFAYFEMSYADSSNTMFFTSFHELSLEPLGFINRSELFVDHYKELYTGASKDLKEKITQENCAKDEITKQPIFGNLVLKHIYGLLAGINRNRLKLEMSGDWWCFPGKNLDEIEEKIYKSLTESGESEDFAGENIQKNYGKIIGQ